MGLSLFLPHACHNCHGSHGFHGSHACFHASPHYPYRAGELRGQSSHLEQVTSINGGAILIEPRPLPNANVVGTHRRKYCRECGVGDWGWGLGIWGPAPEIARDGDPRYTRPPPESPQRRGSGVRGMLQLSKNLMKQSYSLFPRLHFAPGSHR